MIIDSVALRNFKSHADTRITFGPGINVILGDNGAGKTRSLPRLGVTLRSASTRAVTATGSDDGS